MQGKRNAKGHLSTYLKWPAWLIVYFFIVNIIVFIINRDAAYVLFFFVFVYAVFAVYLQMFKYNGLNSAIQKVVTNESKQQGAFFARMGIPNAVLTDKGRITWANDKFLEMSASINVGDNVSELFEELDSKFFENLKDDEIEVLVSTKEKKYLAHIKLLKMDRLEGDVDTKIFDEDEKIVLIYLIDQTELYTLKIENDNNKQVTGFIYIDNFEEITENMEDSKASMLAAMVDRKLTRYISFNSGILKKLEKDKYFFVTTKKDVEDMIDDKFSIIEQTKEIISENNIPLTISIGVGYEGKSIETNHDLARVAMDMALGRGGDQAVVKKGQETFFFGGKSASSSSNARVRARVKATSFRDTLDTKDKVLIMGHKNGDFDSFGASIGTYLMAKQIGKDAHIVINSLTNAVAEMKNRFENSENFDKEMFISGKEALDFADDNTLLIVVDHNTGMISDEASLLEKDLDLVVFDHHRVSANSFTEAVLTYIDPAASSSCEIVSEIMIYFDDRIKIKQLEADTMLAGILIDTMYFTYQTSSKTFDAASFLKKRGADTDRVRKLLRIDVEEEKEKNDAIARTIFYKDGFAITYISEDTKVESNVVKANVANELIAIKGVKASIVLVHEGDAFSISSRSIDEVNVQRLMELLGGGGHRSQAGATIKASTIDEAIDMVKNAIDKMISNGEK